VKSGCWLRSFEDGNVVSASSLRYAPQMPTPPAECFPRRYGVAKGERQHVVKTVGPCNVLKLLTGAARGSSLAGVRVEWCRRTRYLLRDSSSCEPDDSCSWCLTNMPLSDEICPYIEKTQCGPLGSQSRYFVTRHV
jgi:hypothetical protein